FNKLESAIEFLQTKGVSKNEIQMSISLVIRKNILLSCENDYVIKDTKEKIKVDENFFTMFGVSIPRHNYPYNDKILVFSDEASIKQDEVVEIIVDEILLD